MNNYRQHRYAPIKFNNDINNIKNKELTTQINTTEETNKAWGEKNERERRERVANALGFEKDKRLFRNLCFFVLQSTSSD